MSDLSLKCKCGEFRAVVRNFAAETSGRAICYCDDCQAYAQALGRPKEILNQSGGTDITPVMPSQFKILSGASHLRLLRLTPDGLNRFFVECCHSPVVNAPGPQIPYLGLVTALAEDPKLLGRVRFGLQARYAIGNPPPPKSDKIGLGAMLWMMKFMSRALFKGAGKENPFFNKNGQPVAQGRILSHQERESLRPFCGPRPS